MPFQDAIQPTDLAAWSSTIAAALNDALGDRATAAPVVRTRATFAATSPTPSPSDAVAPARFADHYGVDVVDSNGSPLAAVLFVAPDHKTDSDGGLVFAVRVAARLSAGVAVVVVDVAPGPATWAMHLNTLVPVYPTARRPRGPGANVLVVQPLSRDGAEQYAVWYHTVPPGGTFPTVPLPLRDTHLMLDLEASHP